MKKTVVITGSSSGIGAAIAREFAGNENNIVINYKSNKTAALELLNEVRSKGSQAIAIGAGRNLQSERSQRVLLLEFSG